MKRTNDEQVWTNFRFILLLVFFTVVIFACLCKYIFHIPVVESDHYISGIKETERLFDEQRKCAERVKEIGNKIDSLDFSIQQVQRLDEIKEEMFQLQNIYQKHNNSSKYLFGSHSFRIVKGYFDVKEELSAIMENNKVIEQYLEECKANL